MINTLNKDNIDTSMDITPKYLKNIRKIRELKSISPELVASHLQIDVSNYRKLERGETALTFPKLEKICEALDISLETLMSFDESYVLQNCNNIGVGNQPTVNVTQQPDTLIKEIKEFYERIIKEKDEQIALLKSKLN